MKFDYLILIAIYTVITTNTAHIFKNGNGPQKPWGPYVTN